MIKKTSANSTKKIMKTEAVIHLKDEIKANLVNPEILEKLYRENRSAFNYAFNSIYPEIEVVETAKFWKARLDFDSKSEIVKTIKLSEIITVIAICLFTALLIKIPAILRLGLTDEAFYMKNAAIIVFFGLTLCTAWINRITGIKTLIITALAFLIPAIYINLLPSANQGKSVNLAFIHLPFLMWFIYGILFTNYDLRDLDKRTGYIRYTGDLAIVYALIAIAGGILSAVTIGLFNSIGLKIEQLYAENIIITGAAAAPVAGAFIIDKYPSIVSRTAPLIAALFSPLVLITLVVFLITMLVTGKDPYNDRDFLLIFNIMLLGVMAIIIFSVSENQEVRYRKFNAAVLLILSALSIIIDIIALSAIFYRLGEYGLTPNRIAVLVSNVLVLINLILIMIRLFAINFKAKDFGIVEKTVSGFLPVYLVWITIVVFLFPLIFGMK